MNQAPETWIVAAPQDTITSRDRTGVSQSPVGTIPVKFHMYWAGTDRDGNVAGFYWAVVETVPIPPAGFPTLPPLPGPKAQDYHFTTKTDSTFIFRVSEASPDRQHAFFIYAVDNKGKADATPARVIFNALDRFPPLPVIEHNGGARATGKIYTLLENGTVWERDTSQFINDSLTNLNFFIPTSDTVPVSARLDFKWRGEPTIAGTYVERYRYKLDDPEFTTVDTSVTAVSFNTGIGRDRLGPGFKVFTLRAIDQAGGMRQTNRRFQLGYAPDTWFSGPDINQTVYTHDGRDRYIEVSDWTQLAAIPGSLLSCDSLQTWPAERPQRRTFFEIYKNRLYARSEYDTVHMNSWVIFHGGGSDIDSPYRVLITDVDRTADTLVCGPSKTLRPGPPNGSPIGFHFYLATQIEFGPFSTPAQTGVIPTFVGSSVLRAPVIGAYGELRRAGQIFVVLRSDDGQGLYDSRITNRPDRLVASVDHGGTPEEEALRSRILTFYVDKSPYLLTGSPSFIPQPGHTFNSRTLTLNLPADDEDPLDPDTAPISTGGPSPTKVFRWTVSVKGLDAAGDTVYVPPVRPYFTPSITVDMPSEVRPGTIFIDVEICDCAQCEFIVGTGRCSKYVFTADYQPPSSAASVSTPERAIQDRGQSRRGSNP